MAIRKRTKTPKPPLVLIPPPPMPGVNRWLIFGLDPSLSRTGYALMELNKHADGSKARWLEVGSLAPDDASDPIWVRSKHIAMGLKSIVRGYGDKETGLIISMEYPTPQNDFLVALNRIIHVVFFDGPGVPFDKSDTSVFSNNFAAIRVLLTNASTLRSLMGLKVRGAKNKTENIAKAYEFINRESFPNLDTDSCDAVLLAMMGRYTGSFMFDLPQEPPENFAVSLINGTKEIKGAGTRARVITKGILHRPEYWYAYEPRTYNLVHRDARQKSRILHRSQAVI